MINISFRDSDDCERNNNNCDVQYKWSSDPLHSRAASFQFPRKCLNRAGRQKVYKTVDKCRK